MVDYQACADRLIKDGLLLTALELHTELMERGRYDSSEKVFKIGPFALMGYLHNPTDIHEFVRSDTMCCTSQNRIDPIFMYHVHSTTSVHLSDYLKRHFACRITTAHHVEDPAPNPRSAVNLSLHRFCHGQQDTNFTRFCHEQTKY
jgi:hypothetical protein